ncbi:MULTISPECIES: hypothetical protein [Kineococcus]|uniref:hypothetical protein n=1 Tax=unclassified Kineococcus TaxID=2621656 RepID=UPI003D7ED42A
MKVAASGTYYPDEGSRLPEGEVHAWEPGQNQTACGVPLRRAGLSRFPHVDFSDTDPVTGGSADGVRWVCPKCVAATTPRRQRGGRRWERTDPRP